MKKLLIFTNVVSLTAAIFFGCNRVKKEDNTATIKCDHCKDYNDQAFEGIPAGLGYDMIKNYKQDHWDNYTIHGQTVPTDARSVWFSLDTLKKFIWNLEQEVCNNQCVNKDHLGLRFYYADYPDETTWTVLDGVTDQATIDHKNLYQYLHSVVIAPTYLSEGTGMNVDFDPRYVTQKDKVCSPATMSEVFEKLGVDFNTELTAINGGQPSFMLSPDIRTSARNKGSLIPPPPPTIPNTTRSTVSGNGAVIFDMMENDLHTY